MEYDAFANFTANSPAGILLWAWELYYPSGSYIVDSAFTTSAEKAGCCNYAWYSSMSLDQLTVEAHRTTSATEVVQLYKQMDKIVVQEEVLWVPMVYPKPSRLRQLEGAELPSFGWRWGGPVTFLLQVLADVSRSPAHPRTRLARPGGPSRQPVRSAATNDRPSREVHECN
jgi:ABC-type transport system substrate-binding protein